MNPKNVPVKNPVITLITKNNYSYEKKCRNHI